MSPKKWIEATEAIGIVSKAGRYGGTYAHSDIAMSFATIIISLKRNPPAHNYNVNSLVIHYSYFVRLLQCKINSIIAFSFCTHVWSKNYAYFRSFFIIYAFLQESNATKLMGKKFISSYEKAIKKFQTLLALGDYKDVKTQTKCTIMCIF